MRSFDEYTHPTSSTSWAAPATHNQLMLQHNVEECDKLCANAAETCSRSVVRDYNDDEAHITYSLRPTE